MRILVVHPYGIGDLIMALPLLHGIKRADPKGFLGVLTNRRVGEWVRSTFPVDWHGILEKDELQAIFRSSWFQGIQTLFQLLTETRKMRWEALIDLTMGWHCGLGARLAGIPRRVGFDVKGRGRFLTQKIPLWGFNEKSVSEYYLDLLPLSGIPRPADLDFGLKGSPDLEGEVHRYLEGLSIRPTDQLVGLVVGGGTSWGRWASFKQWPPGRFNRLADWLAQRYDLVPLLIGDEEEASLCQAAASGLRLRHALAIGVPSLTLLGGILKRCLLVVGNDSGPMHLAYALGVKTVTIFGPVDPVAYGPGHQPSRHRLVAKTLACRPCYQGFRFPPCPWDNTCLKGLEVQQVQEAVEALLG